MLARSAQGLYWMSRHLERAEYLARMLGLQGRTLIDRPPGEIHFGWRRLYGSLRRRPPAGDIDPDPDDDYTLADSYTLAGDLTFERSNPDSLRSCFAAGRENARQVRHCISREMWTSLNLAWLRLKDLDIQDIWTPEPESFYGEMIRTLNAIDGVASATMYRGAGWQFLRLGTFIERSQLMAALAATHLRILETDDGSEWTSLLKACQALDSYESVHGIDRRPDRILGLLIADTLHPGSLADSLTSAESCLAAIGAQAGSPDDAAAAIRLAGRLRARIAFDWPDSRDQLSLIDGVGQGSRDLHDLVNSAWFEYPIGTPSA